MTDQDSWHSQDAFWELIEPMLFNPQRLSQAKDEVGKIEVLLQVEAGARILDLCCGVGRHSLELARRGYEVVGVDRTTAYIERARTEAGTHDLNAVFEVGDMREFCLPDSFDVVLNLFGSFGYFEAPEDDRRVAGNMVASLRPGGRFMVETMGKEILAREFVARDWTEAGDLLLLSEKTISQNWGRVETRWIAIRGTERVEHRVSVRSYSAVELTTLFASCGFTDIRVFGSLDGIEYDQEAQRLVVIGRKPVG